MNISERFKAASRDFSLTAAKSLAITLALPAKTLPELDSTGLFNNIYTSAGLALINYGLNRLTDLVRHRKRSQEEIFKQTVENILLVVNPVTLITVWNSEIPVSGKIYILTILGAINYISYYKLNQN